MGRCAFCSSAAFLASAGNVLGIEGERELGYEAYIIHTSPWSSQILHKMQRLLISRETRTADLQLEWHDIANANDVLLLTLLSTYAIR